MTKANDPGALYRVALKRIARELDGIEYDELTHAEKKIMEILAESYALDSSLYIKP